MSQHWLLHFCPSWVQRDVFSRKLKGVVCLGVDALLGCSLLRPPDLVVMSTQLLTECIQQIYTNQFEDVRSVSKATNCVTVSVGVITHAKL